MRGFKFAYKGPSKWKKKKFIYRLAIFGHRRVASLYFIIINLINSRRDAEKTKTEKRAFFIANGDTEVLPSCIIKMIKLSI
ncbi:hypothetical protein Salpa_0835 [Sporomusa sp. KB1]|nr:hypothetical protein Salpa_0835 [Sporomusa sp. KB1]